MLGLAIGTSKSQLARARQRVRDLLMTRSSTESTMMEDGPGELRRALSRIEPPAKLEGRVGASVRPLLETRDAALGTRQPRWRWVERLALIAAGVLLGIGVRAMLTGSRPNAGSPGQYVLFLFGDTPGDTGAVHVAREREYGRWASALTDAKWVGGSELADVVVGLGPDGLPSKGRATRRVLRDRSVFTRTRSRSRAHLSTSQVRRTRGRHGRRLVT
jgi:hypothetical protein